MMASIVNDGGAYITITADKLLAAQSGAANPPTSLVEAQTIKLTMHAFNDQQEPDALPIRISNQRSEAIWYFDSHHKRLKPKVDGDAWIECGDSSADGELVVYICAPAPIIFNAQVMIERCEKAKNGSEVDWVDVVFFDYAILDESQINPDFPPPTLPFYGQVYNLPNYDSLLYGQYANVPVAPAGQDAVAATFCNGQLINISAAGLLANYFLVPYHFIKEGPHNTLCYLVDYGPQEGSPLASPQSSFRAAGAGLIMPNPLVSAIDCPAPEWTGGQVLQPLTIGNIEQGLTLLLTMVSDVKEGDSYDLYVYINGYDAHTGAPKQPPSVLVYYNEAPKQAVAGQQIACTIPMEDLLGYSRYQNHYGYLWANCLIKGVSWTPLWAGGPVLIAF